MLPQDAVAEVRQDGAAEVASAVVSEVAVTASITQGDVAAVGNALSEHAERSEDRHDEIVEEVEQCQDGQQLLLTAIQGIQLSLSTSLQAMQAQQAAIQDQLRLLMDSRQLTPTPPVSAVVEVVEPESVEEDPPAAPTAPKRRARPI